MRTSLVASKYIEKGEQLSLDNVTTKRPANRNSPMRVDEIIGRVAHKSFERDELIIV